MRLVITGASGFVGRNIIPLLQKAGHDLLLVGRDMGSLAAQFPEHHVASYDELDQRAVGYDALLHLAVLSNDTAASLQAFEMVNVDLLKRVLQACRVAGVSKVIYPASMQASLSGTNYAVSKAKAEELLNAVSSEFVIAKLRRPIVYGDSFAGKLSFLNSVPQVMKGPLLNVMRSLKPTAHVRKITDAVETALHRDSSYEILVTDGQNENWFYTAVKRLTDLSFAVFVFVFLWWLLLGVWVAIKSTSKGPAIFAQQRVGRFGKNFTLYKFRTMGIDTKQAATHEVSSEAVIPIGGFLRKSKIDELPQVWNIIRGEISLVGPRPCLPVQIDLVVARKVRGVLDIPPGITGFAQVQGIDMSDPERLSRVDEEYVKLRTLILDLKILIMTAIGRGNADWVK